MLCFSCSMFQSPDDCAVSITNIIRHHESEYLSSLEVWFCLMFIQPVSHWCECWVMLCFLYAQESYLNLSDATFKVGRNGQLDTIIPSATSSLLYFLWPLLHVWKLFIILAQDLRRKLPVTRTLFPWHNTLAFSLTRDLAKELALGKWSLQAMSLDCFKWIFLISMPCAFL
jgi:capping protein alpha